tara:strand:- start:2475 stop:2774 length:300 start_codon:yes stop_codon:yes gene_type:complete
MPLDISTFPDEVQVAFFMFNLLSDRWEGMSGSYMGKDWSHCEHLFSLYEVEEPTIIMYFMKMYENLLVGHRLEEAERKRKAEERKKQTAGKTFTHNVRG